MSRTRLTPEAHHWSAHEYPVPVTECPRCKYDMQVCLSKEHHASFEEAMLRVRVVNDANQTHREGQRTAIPYRCRWCPVTRGMPGWHIKTAKPHRPPALSDVEA